MMTDPDTDDLSDVGAVLPRDARRVDFHRVPDLGVPMTSDTPTLVERLRTYAGEVEMMVGLRRTRSPSINQMTAWRGAILEAATALDQRDETIARLTRELAEAEEETRLACGKFGHVIAVGRWMKKAEQAESRAEAAEARLAEAERVMELFANEAYRYLPDTGDGDDTLWAYADSDLRIKHLRAARAFLTSQGDKS